MPGVGAHGVLPSERRLRRSRSVAGRDGGLRGQTSGRAPIHRRGRPALVAAASRTRWSIFAFAARGQGDNAGELFAILNPIHRSSTPNAIARYKVEPYAACADVSSVAPHVGRGGWTWYTGSAGWLYRAGLEAILGFRVHGNTLVIDPCMPKMWPGYEIVFRHRGDRNTVTRYEITVENPRRVCRGVVGAELDGVDIAKGVARILIVDDGQIHRVRIELG